METSPRPKLRPTKRPRLRPSEEEMADIEAGRTIERANRLKKLIDIESEGLFDKTPLVPIRPPTGDRVKGMSRKKFRSRNQDGVKEQTKERRRKYERTSFRGTSTQQFTLGGDVRHNPNRGKTY